MLDRLYETIDATRDEIVQALCDCVPEYRPQQPCAPLSTGDSEISAASAAA